VISSFGGFLSNLRMKSICYSQLIKTTLHERSHAQKYFLKIQKELKDVNPIDILKWCEMNMFCLNL
jgi:hypothetical protein